MSLRDVRAIHVTASHRFLPRHNPFKPFPCRVLGSCSNVSSIRCAVCTFPSALFGRRKTTLQSTDFTMMKETTLRIVSLALFIVSSDAFTVALPTTRGVACHFASLHSSILISTIETFDGSQIVDPIVVSGVFWSSLKTRLLSLIIGQVLATIVFGVLATLTASQLSKVGEWITSTIGEQMENPFNADESKTHFVKANQVKYT